MRSSERSRGTWLRTSVEGPPPELETELLRIGLRGGRNPDLVGLCGIPEARSQPPHPAAAAAGELERQTLAAQQQPRRLLVCGAQELDRQDVPRGETARQVGDQTARRIAGALDFDRDRVAGRNRGVEKQEERRAANAKRPPADLHDVRCGQSLPAALVEGRFGSLGP